MRRPRSGRGRSTRRTGPWSAAEIERLKDLLGAAPLEAIAARLGRGPSEVAIRIEALARSARRTGPWLPEEDRLLKRLYGSREDAALALRFGRSEERVRSRAASLGLSKDKAFLRRRFGPGASRMPRWTEGEERKLRFLYPRRSNLEIARALGRTVKSVLSKAHDLRLRKSTARLEEMGRANVAVRYRRASTPSASATAGA